MNHLIFHISVVAALGTIGGCVAAPSETTSTFLCSTSSECNGLTGAEGYLCVDRNCVECRADWECRRVEHYGEGAVCTAGRCLRAPDRPMPTKPECTPGDLSCVCLAGDVCRDGNVCDRSACRAPLTCDGLDCDGGLKCEPSGEGRDARCVEACPGGFTWDAVQGECVRSAANCALDSPASIALQCQEEGRKCVEGANEAWCGDCAESLVDVEGRCEPAVSCADLDCEARGEGCSESPNGHCTKICLEGYVRSNDGDQCLKTCALLSCGDLAGCEDSDGQQDARCVIDEASCGDVPACGDGEAFNPLDDMCFDCGGLRCEANDLQTGRLFPLVTNQLRCVCETRDGAYFDPMTKMVQACDSDGDGWVRQGARAAMDAKNRPCRTLGDPMCDCALATNARCDVNTIDSVVLHTAMGGKREVKLSSDPFTQVLLQNGRLALYETDTNDELRLRGSRGAPVLPVYQNGGATSGRSLRADEINSFTKACVNATADFNGNAHPDLTEYHGMGQVPGGDWLRPFVHFSYFVELAEGWFEPRETGQPGRFHIAERARSEKETGSLLPFVTETQQDHSQKCLRKTDAAFVSNPSRARPNIGMDFQRFNATNDSVDTASEFAQVLGHGSQFKCLQVMDKKSAAVSRTVPHQVVATSTSDRSDFDLYACGTTGNDLATGINCVQIADSSWVARTVAWGRVAYHGYETTGGYIRGCINECLDSPDRFTKIGSEQGNFGCTPSPEQFGFGVCGCLPGWKGSKCDEQCPYWFIDDDNDDFAHPDFLKGPSCGSPGVNWKSAYTLPGFDCNDSDASVHPNGIEVCDGLDNDCSGIEDDNILDERLGQVCDGADQDMCRDGHWTCTSGQWVCDDDPSSIEEVCDGADNNCDGSVDEGFDVGGPCKYESGIGVCEPPGTWTCSTAGLECVPALRKRNDFRQHAAGVSGSWDWNCDGTEEREHPLSELSGGHLGFTYVSRTQGTGQASDYMVKFVDPRCVGRDFKRTTDWVFDARVFCGLNGGLRDLTPYPLEKPEEYQNRKTADARARCRESWTIPLENSKTSCGDNILRISCQWNEEGYCEPQGGLGALSVRPYCMCSDDRCGNCARRNEGGGMDDFDFGCDCNSSNGKTDCPAQAWQAGVGYHKKLIWDNYRDTGKVYRTFQKCR